MISPMQKSINVTIRGMKATVHSELESLPFDRLLQIINAVLQKRLDDGLVFAFVRTKNREMRSRYVRDERQVQVALNESSRFPARLLVAGGEFELRSLEECALVLVACALNEAAAGVTESTDWAQEKLEAYRRGELPFASVTDRRPRH